MDVNGRRFCIHYNVYIHVLMRDEKEERSKQGQTNNKAKQHSMYMKEESKAGQYIQ